MEANIGFGDKVKLAIKYSSYKINQHRLTTNEKAIVDTIYGKVQGVKRISIYGHPYYSFEKIPFAKPPVGELRFKAPQEPIAWSEIKDCTKVGPKPKQKNLFIKKVEGSEDCLYLNVYTKSLKPTKALPVMVWIYGGGFQVGEASREVYSPEYFMQEDVVFISVTYRLGPFGFLSLDDPSLEVPGNAGLKDQVLALKWAKNNCARFGGDPDNITIFGESAGGASTHYMMLTDQTKGLFNKAIIMSGSALCPWAELPRRNWAHRLAQAMGYKGDFNDKDILEFLSKAKSTDVIKYGENLLTPEERKSRIPFSFGPIVEPYESKDCVVPKKPIEMMKDTWSNSIPLMIGGTSFEGLLLFNEIKCSPELLKELNCEDLVPHELHLENDNERRRQLGQQIKATYFGDKEPSMDTKFEYMTMYSDKYWWHPINRTVLSRLENATAPTYLYRFDFDSKFFNFLRIMTCGKKIRGTCHGDDISYLFHNSVAKKLKKKTKEYKTIERMIGTWTKFAADPTADPNNEHLGSVAWTPLKKDDTTLKCLNISDEVQVIDLPEMDRIEVWKSMYSREQLY